MYFARIVFFLENGHDLKIGESRIEEPIELFNSGSKKCTLKIDRRMNKKKVIITYGLFGDEEDAKAKGSNLLDSIKVLFIRQGIPIKINSSRGVLDSTKKFADNGGFTYHGLANVHHMFPELEGVHVENELLGLGIYEADESESLEDIKFMAQSLGIELRSNIPEITDEYSMNKDLRTSYSMMNTSNLIQDNRAKFIVRITALEALVSNRIKHESDFCNVVDELLKDYVSELRLDSLKPLEDAKKLEYLNRLKNSIGRIKEKSIGEKCRELIVNSNLSKKYYEMDAITFFNKCYSIRSKFIHYGDYDVSVVDSYLVPLNELVLDVLEKQDNQ